MEFVVCNYVYFPYVFVIFNYLFCFLFVSCVSSLCLLHAKSRIYGSGTPVLVSWYDTCIILHNSHIVNTLHCFVNSSWFQPESCVCFPLTSTLSLCMYSSQILFQCTDVWVVQINNSFIYSVMAIMCLLTFNQPFLLPFCVTLLISLCLILTSAALSWRHSLTVSSLALLDPWQGTSP